MRIYDGRPRQDYEEVFRSLGAFIDLRGMRSILILEAPDGFVVQGVVPITLDPASWISPRLTNGARNDACGVASTRSQCNGSVTPMPLSTCSHSSRAASTPTRCDTWSQAPSTAAPDDQPRQPTTALVAVADRATSVSVGCSAVAVT